MFITIGDNMEQLKHLRLEHNLTRRQLAQMIYVTEVTLFNWERGKTYPSEIYRHRLADVLNVPLSFFDKEYK
jgi:phage transcriptional repressor